LDKYKNNTNNKTGLTEFFNKELLLFNDTQLDLFLFDFDSILWTIVVDNDLQLQKDWINLLKPDFCHLKFRFPFDLAGKYPYFKGKVLFQVFAGISSTETRLLFNKNKKGEYDMYDWDPIKYENQLSYFNNITRKQYYNCIPISAYNKEGLKGFDGCYDCCGEIAIWEKCIKAFVPKEEQKNMRKSVVAKILELNNILSHERYKNTPEKIKSVMEEHYMNKHLKVYLPEYVKMDKDTNQLQINKVIFDKHKDQLIKYIKKNK
jgi:hypothetical protein